MRIPDTGGEKIAKTNNQIRTPDDAYGLKAQTFKADVQIELVKKMSENPTPIS